MKANGRPMDVTYPSARYAGDALKPPKQAYVVDLNRSSFFCCVGHGDAAL